MLQFGIRDLFFAMALVGMGAAWWVSDRAWRVHSEALNAERIAVIHQAEDLRNTVRHAKSRHDEMRKDIRDLYLYGHPPMSEKGTIMSRQTKVDWSVMDKPIPSP